MKKGLLVGLALVALFALWLYSRASAPHKVPFAKARRERLVSTLVTNGKVEPSRWVAIRAERSGVVAKVFVERGQRVRSGAAILEFDARDARAQLAAAEAKIDEIRVELDVMRRGGGSRERTELESQLARVRLDLSAARRELESLERLAAKQAATRQQVTEARERVQQFQAQEQALERKRAALVSEADRKLAEARLKEAQAARDQALHRIEESLLRAPMEGVIYDLEARAGAYLNPGDTVAHVGNLEKLRVRVYVDEPELGRVAQGQPVAITWDALAGRDWKGFVEKLPTSVFTLGTRHVGEVICTIDNPRLELLPGTNVNAEITAQVVENALTIPREALRRQSEQQGVFVLDGERIKWRAIQVGASSVTRIQVTSGLSEGDAVALPTERSLTDGMEVEPAYP